MFIACENVGKRKSNARPTLHTFINEYQTKAKLDPKILTQLIKEFRNTATHHFNVEWDDSLMVLKQFCRFVEWFADHHATEATDHWNNVQNLEKATIQFLNCNQFTRIHPS